MAAPGAYLVQVNQQQHGPWATLGAPAWDYFPNLAVEGVHIAMPNNRFVGDVFPVNYMPRERYDHA